MSSAQPDRSLAEQLTDQLAVEARTHRRTALVALQGELDMLTVSKVAEVLDGLMPQADGVRHVVLDLRGLTFMDLPGLHELIRQNEFARSNRHNLAVVRGTDAIERLLAVTGVKDHLVLVDDPDDLVPPPMANGRSVALAAFVASLLAVAHRGATVVPGPAAIIGRCRAIVSRGSALGAGRVGLIRVDGVADCCVDVSLSGASISSFSCAISAVGRAIGLVEVVFGGHPGQE